MKIQNWTKKIQNDQLRNHGDCGCFKGSGSFPYHWWARCVHLEWEASNSNPSISSYKFFIFGFRVLEFLQNSRVMVHNLLSNLFLYLLNMIIHRSDEGSKCQKIPNSINHWRGSKWALKIQGYTWIRRVRPNSINFCTSKVHFHRRPWRTITIGVCPIIEIQYQGSVLGVKLKLLLIAHFIQIWGFR